MAQVKLRYNLDTEEVELVVDDKVAMGSGQDVFKSWVDAYNEKHKPEAPVEEKVVDTSTEEIKSVDSPVEEEGEALDDNTKE